jgi:hypothetical protein
MVNSNSLGRQNMPKKLHFFKLELTLAKFSI